MRTCSTCGHPYQPKVHSQRFCTSQCRDRKLGRKPRIKHGTTTQRGYGSTHQRERERWRPLVDRGEVDCWRCGHPILPGTPWHLGHDDYDRTVYRGPEHPRCNLIAAAANGNRARNQQRYTSSAPRIAR